MRLSEHSRLRPTRISSVFSNLTIIDPTSFYPLRSQEVGKKVGGKEVRSKLRLHPQTNTRLTLPSTVSFPSICTAR